MLLGGSQAPVVGFLNVTVIPFVCSNPPCALFHMPMNASSATIRSGELDLTVTVTVKLPPTARCDGMPLKLAVAAPAGGGVAVEA